jgi:hypothetical protein
LPVPRGATCRPQNASFISTDTPILPFWLRITHKMDGAEPYAPDRQMLDQVRSRASETRPVRAPASANSPRASPKASQWIASIGYARRLLPSNRSDGVSGSREKLRR